MNDIQFPPAFYITRTIIFTILGVMFLGFALPLATGDYPPDATRAGCIVYLGIGAVLTILGLLSFLSLMKRHRG